MAGCGSGDDEAASTTTVEEQPAPSTTVESVPTTTERKTTTAKPAPQPAPPKLTRAGYAASREAWLALRDPDPNPKLDPACCFLPREEDGRDRYVAVFYNEKGLAYSYTMNFAPPVDEETARLLLRDEFPKDARVVGRKDGGRCLMLGYRSKAARQAIGYADALVAFYSGPEGGYTGSVSEIIIIGGLSVADGQC